MRVFGRLLGRRPRPEAILAEAIERLQVGILTDLILQYTSQMESSEAVLLADCVLGHAILMEPAGVAAQDYEKAHTELVHRRALELAGIAEVAGALSCLYAAITLRLTIRTRNPFSEEAERIGARATELLLYIPNTYDICGSDDAMQCIQAIAVFAEDYLQRSFGRRGPDVRQGS